MGYTRRDRSEFVRMWVRWQIFSLIIRLADTGRFLTKGTPAYSVHVCEYITRLKRALLPQAFKVAPAVPRLL